MWTTTRWLLLRVKCTKWPRPIRRGYAWTEQTAFKDDDPETYAILRQEKERQLSELNLVASENYMSRSTIEAHSTCVANKVAEGLPAARYFGGAQYVDEVERLCWKRALETFRLDPDRWGLNCQVFSRSSANLVAYMALMKPRGRLMGLDVKYGGHYSHGYLLDGERAAASSIYWNSMPYRVKKSTGLIDFEHLEDLAKLFGPQVILAGSEAHPRLPDFAKFKKICDVVDAYFLVDMSDMAGQVAAGLCQSPFDFADVVTTSLSHTLRGPKLGLIFYRKGVRRLDKKGQEVLYNLEKSVNFVVFPSLQGAPHFHKIASAAIALRQASSDHFRAYQQLVLGNAQYLAEKLQERGFCLLTGGTDKHHVVVDLSSRGIDVGCFLYLCAQVGIIARAVTAGPQTQPCVQMGIAALTTRGIDSDGIDDLIECLDELASITMVTQNISANQGDGAGSILINRDAEERLNAVQGKVSQLTSQLDMPGFEDF